MLYVVGSRDFGSRYSSPCRVQKREGSFLLYLLATPSGKLNACVKATKIVTVAKIATKNGRTIITR